MTGVHQPGESHFELLRAFADDALLHQISMAFCARGYRPHEFGNSMLIERRLVDGTAEAVRLAECAPRES